MYDRVRVEKWGGTSGVAYDTNETYNIPDRMTANDHTVISKGQV